MVFGLVKDEFRLESCCLKRCIKGEESGAEGLEVKDAAGESGSVGKVEEGS
jgi:hypothetical protein